MFGSMRPVPRSLPQDPMAGFLPFGGIGKMKASKISKIICQAAVNWPPKILIYIRHKVFDHRRAGWDNGDGKGRDCGW